MTINANKWHLAFRVLYLCKWKRTERRPPLVWMPRKEWGIDDLLDCWIQVICWTPLLITTLTLRKLWKTSNLSGARCSKSSSPYSPLSPQPLAFSRVFRGIRETLRTLKSPRIPPHYPVNSFLQYQHRFNLFAQLKNTAYLCIIKRDKQIVKQNRRR